MMSGADLLAIATGIVAFACILVTFIFTRRIDIAHSAQDDPLKSLERITPKSTKSAGNFVEEVAGHTQPDQHVEGFPVNAPSELLYAYAILRHELTASEKAAWISESVLISSPIQVISSDYAHNGHLLRLQRTILAQLEGMKDPAEKFLGRETSSFLEVPPELSGHKRFVYTFPLYLTDVKREAGFAVLPYGQHRTLGALIPQYSAVLPNSDVLTAGNWTLEDLLSRIQSHNGEVFAVRNYAMAELIVQSVDISPTLRYGFDLSRLRQLDYTRDNTPDLPFLQRLSEIKSMNWAFVFDLGDLSRIKLALPQYSSLSASQVTTVHHSLNVPVGLGFNRYMLPWLLEASRWERLHSFLQREMENPLVVNALEGVGVEVTGAAAKEKWAKAAGIATLRPRPRPKT